MELRVLLLNKSYLSCLVHKKRTEMHIFRRLLLENQMLSLKARSL